MKLTIKAVAAVRQPLSTPKSRVEPTWGSNYV
jgi:hypothetical protein